MTMVINGSGTITGLSAGGLPDASVTASDLASGAARSNFGAGAVLQVASTTKTDTFSSASTSYVDITGLSVSITPSSASSKILVLVVITTSNNASQYNNMVQLVRNSTAIAIGDASSSRSQASAQGRLPDGNGGIVLSVNTLDSPSSTSSVTYKMQIKVQGGTAAINKTDLDPDSSAIARTVSTITVMEIAA